MISAAKIIEKSDSAKKSVVFLLCRKKTVLSTPNPSIRKRLCAKDLRWGGCWLKTQPDTQPKTQPNTPPSLFLASFGPLISAIES